MPDIESLADPIREVHGHLDTLVRLSAASGVQVADRALQRHLEVERAERRAREDEARQATEREKAQRELARLLWRRAFDVEWWDQATEEQIAQSYEAAFVYAGTVPDAADALVRLDQEIERRSLREAADPPAGSPEAPTPAAQRDESPGEAADAEMTGEVVRAALDRIRSEHGLVRHGQDARPVGGSALLDRDEVATTMAAHWERAAGQAVER